MRKISLLLCLVLAGCASTPDQTKDENKAHPEVENARTSVNWQGTYQGIFPCADCEGIATMLSLNPDMTYALRTRELGKEEIDKKSNGTFTWNKKNSHISFKIGEQVRTFRVGQGFVQLTQADGRPIKASNPERYYLEKTD